MEVLTLVPPVVLILGICQNHIDCADGAEHYFTMDGYYDGWARKTNGLTDCEVDRLIDRVEASREIECT